ncbi:MAG: endolytic transglycosylase MltG [Actinomycetota bacterium]|nr:endolytic transglycosylase MltG [Actinomycetota bacterium]
MGDEPAPRGSARGGGAGARDAAGDAAHGIGRQAASGTGAGASTAGAGGRWQREDARSHRRGRGWHARRRSSARGLSLVGVLVTAVACVVGAVAYGVVWFAGAVGEGPAGPATVVAVAPGSSVGAVVADLVRHRVVSSGLAFRLYDLLHGDPVIAAGDYLLHVEEPFAALLHRLSQGPDVFTVSVPVGTTVYELARQVAQEVPVWSSVAFGAAATTGRVRSPFQPAGSTNLNGLLGTGTYLVMPGETPVQLLEAMVRRFDAEAATAGLAGAAAGDGVTPYQAVTIASIVEKEGYYPKNFGGVARVIYNRLAIGMRLQMDTTVLYALHQDGGPVTPAEEQVPSPYNTYLHHGLPPSPICFPSAGALAAALHPPPGTWLYFELVSKSGTEAFETTYAQHLRDIALARQRGLP